MDSVGKTPTSAVNRRTFALTYKWIPSRAKSDCTRAQLRHDEPLLNLLSRFYKSYGERGLDSPFVVKEAQALSGTFGLASWGGETSSEAWLNLAQTVVTHKALFRALRSGGTRDFRGTLKMRLEALNQRAPITQTEALEWCEMLPEDMAHVPPEDGPAGWPKMFPTLKLHATPGNLTELERAEQMTLEHIAVTAAGKTPKMVRIALADSLYNAFGGFFYLKRGHILVQTWGIQVECSADVWVNYLLSQMWREGLEPRVCDGCGALFTPNDKRQKYCVTEDGRCEKRSHRRDKA